ncbi:hypothetical protein Mycch_0435 [Mycolicibacterium chubuense NBB4]|uniref:DUF4242 domain-containing protein n=1 Tax=Mycolicibacterium chubuense (strain NBB4) TaxID=710421 RepID=I4BD98_MYCCN|nr:hypothetical protein [Mycolicibacterium chubuense]AFM15255.1 hypothetical protein Mycch_0435 [Mycolicibacterium chubuense NBB4]
MGTTAPCYLVEWYQPPVTEAVLSQTAAKLADSAAAMSARGCPVRLLTMVSVPSDEVLFGLFAADSADHVAETCSRAGIPASRLAAAIATST